VKNATLSIVGETLGNMKKEKPRILYQGGRRCQKGRKKKVGFTRGNRFAEFRGEKGRPNDLGKGGFVFIREKGKQGYLDD